MPRAAPVTKATLSSSRPITTLRFVQSRQCAAQLVHHWRNAHDLSGQWSLEVVYPDAKRRDGDVRLACSAIALCHKDSREDPVRLGVGDQRCGAPADLSPQPLVALGLAEGGRSGDTDQQRIEG